MHNTPHSPETIKKIKEARARQTFTPERNMKISLALRGRKRSLESRLKMSLVQKGKKHSPERIEANRLGQLGKKLSEATKQKISIYWQNRHRKELPYTIEEISSMYLEQNMSLRQIGEICGCDGGTIKLRLKKSGYTIRTVKDSANLPHMRNASSERMKHWHKDNPTYGEFNSFYGKTHSEETKRKIQIARGKQLFSPESILKRSKSLKDIWDSYTPTQRNERIYKMWVASQRQPNSKEAYLFSLLESAFPNEWGYVGNGTLVLNGLIPDFVSVDGNKHIIELFGDYWHRGENPRDREIKLAERGYSALIIWEHELDNPDDVLAKVKKIFY